MINFSDGSIQIYLRDFPKMIVFSETVLHRLHLQGTRSIIDNLDTGAFL